MSRIICYHFYNSSMAQWKRAGPITPRSLDRNKLLLKIILIFSTSRVRAGLLSYTQCTNAKINVLRQKYVNAKQLT